MKKCLNFTKESIGKLEKPTNRMNYYQDTKEKDLSLYITSNGYVIFFIRKAIERKDKRIIIGKFPEISVTRAREIAFKIKSQIATGDHQTKQKPKNATTFKQIFEEYMERYSKKEKRSWEYDERAINRFLKQWFNRDVADIKKEDVLDIHQKVSDKNGIYAANRLLAVLRSIYNKAIEWDLINTENPTIGIKKFKKKSRERFLQSDEIARFFKRVKEEKNEIIRDYILISLFTGVRKSNVLSMEWNQIDEYRKTWRIPDTKNGSPLIVPITEDVINILNARKTDNIKLEFKNSPFIFPGNGKTGHLVEPKKTWCKILQETNIKDFRLHDLRRTFGSWQAISGSSSLVIGKSLGHKSQSATEVYTRLSMDPVRTSIENGTKLMLDIANKDNKSD